MEIDLGSHIGRAQVREEEECMVISIVYHNSFTIFQDSMSIISYIFLKIGSLRIYNHKCYLTFNMEISNHALRELDRKYIY